MFALLLSLCLSKSAIPEPEESIVWTNGDLGSQFYRIPAVARAHDGSLVTLTDQRWNSKSDLPNKIWVVCRRSEDNGKTWQESTVVAEWDKGYGDASIIADRDSDRVIAIFNGANGFFQSVESNPIRHYVSTSPDCGKTWGPIKEITNYTFGINCTDPIRKAWKGMFLSSGHSLQLRNGRIMVVGVVQKASGSSISNHAVYSDDFGETWDVGGEACDCGDESKVVELNNGDVLMSIRHSPYRLFAISHDQGKTFEPYYKEEEIVDPACNGDIIRYTSVIDGYDKNRLIHTIPYAHSRSNVSVLISYDEGKTWPIKKSVCTASSIYSSVDILSDGRIGVYYERDKTGGGFDLVFATMTLEWLTDGDDKYVEPVL